MIALKKISDPILCGQCPYAAPVGGGRWKPPVSGILRCSVQENPDLRMKSPSDRCDRGHTYEMFVYERYPSGTVIHRGYQSLAIQMKDD